MLNSETKLFPFVHLVEICNHYFSAICMNKIEENLSK